MFRQLAVGIRERWHPLWRLRQIPAYRWLQQKMDRTVYTRIPETGIEVAVKALRDASWIATPTGLEPEIRLAFELVMETLKPTVFWDIGANIGFYSWRIRQNPSVREVVMFEPDPINFGLISSTIRKNAITDCRPVNVALSDQCGEISFLIDRASGAAGSLEKTSQRENSHSLHRAYQMNETIVCKTVTVDSLLAEGLTPPELIKIDVEGAEHLVIAGAETCLSKNRPVLVVETGDAGVMMRLREWGYQAYRIDAGNLLFVPIRPGLDLTPFDQAFSRYKEES